MLYNWKFIIDFADNGNDNPKINLLVLYETKLKGILRNDQFSRFIIWEYYDTSGNKVVSSYPEWSFDQQYQLW